MQPSLLLLLLALPRGGKAVEASQLLSTTGSVSQTKVTEDCPVAKATCEQSGACNSLELVKKRFFISEDNILEPSEIQGLEMLRAKLRGKHLRIRSSLNWLGVAGFFTYPVYVMNQILFAKKFGFIGTKAPFVYMPETSHYHDNCNTSSRFPHPTEFWNKWFQPIATVRPEDVDESDVWEFSQLTIESIHHNKAAVHSYPYQMHGKRMKGEAGTLDWAKCHRHRAVAIMKKYIRLKNNLLIDARDYYTKNFMNFSSVLGVHMRGTDKWITDKIGPATYGIEIENFLSEKQNTAVFVATDDEKYLHSLQSTYKNKIIARDSLRDAKNILFNDSVDKDQKAYEVLMDSILLSSTDKLVKSWSGVSEFSVYLRMQLGSLAPRFDVIDVQLNDDLNADSSSTCKYSESMKGSNEHVTMHGPKMSKFDFLRSTDRKAYNRTMEERCGRISPHIVSTKALNIPRTRRACSRECVRYRSEKQTWKPAKSMRNSKTALLVVSHFRENDAWLANEQPFCYIVVEKQGSGYDFGADPSEVVINKGNEASSYLHFIIQNYENLPENLIMIHADRRSEHAVDLAPMLGSLDLDSYGYASLNGIIFPMVDVDDHCDIHDFYMSEIKHKGFADQFPPFPRDFTGISTACCAQFMVSKDRILIRPKRFYQSVYNFTTGSIDYGHWHGETMVDGQSQWKGYDSLLETSSSSMVGSHRQKIAPPSLCEERNIMGLNSFSRGEALELTWHVIFGQPWKNPPVDPLRLCGSPLRCPQDLNIIKKQLGTIGVVANPKDPFWYPASVYKSALTLQAATEYRPSQYLITTPNDLDELEVAEKSVELMVFPTPKIVKQYALSKDKTKTVYNLSSGALEDPRIRWFSDLMVNKTFREPENINILLYNDDPCGVDLFGLRAEPFIRFTGCGAPVRLYSSRHRYMMKFMDIVLISEGWSHMVNGKTRPDPKLKTGGQVWATCSVENGVTYNTTNNDKKYREKTLIDYMLAARPGAEIPISFWSQFYIGANSIRSVLREPKPLPTKHKIPKVSVMQAACTKLFGYRNNWTTSFVHEIPKSVQMIASLGKCWHNTEPLFDWGGSGMGNRPMAFHANKRANIRPYMFTLCHESVEGEDWITEKVYQALAVGSVPVYRGSLSIEEKVPCKHCVIDANKFESPKKLAEYLMELIKDKKKYEAYLAWKNVPYKKEDYPIFEKHIRSKSIDGAICRLASKIQYDPYIGSVKRTCDDKCLEEVYHLQRYSPHG